MNQLELIVLTGLPALGKTTFMNDHLQGYRRASKDRINFIIQDDGRFEYAGSVQSRFVHMIETELIKFYLRGLNQNAVVDNTNIDIVTRKKYVDICGELRKDSFRISLIAVDFGNDLELALERNSRRNKIRLVEVHEEEHFIEKNLKPILFEKRVEELKRSYPMPVPDAAILRMHDMYQPPTKDEGFDFVCGFSEYPTARRRWGLPV